MFRSRNQKKKNKRKAKKAILNEIPTPCPAPVKNNEVQLNQTAPTATVESPPETGRTNGDSDSILLKKIYGLQKSNCEIIERVESVKNVESYSYKLQISETFEVSVNETHHVQDVLSLIQKFRSSVLIVSGFGGLAAGRPVQRRTMSWADLKSLNEDLIAPLSMLDLSTEKVQQILPRILVTLETIQIALGEAEELTISTPSKLSKMNGIIAEVNDRFAALANEGAGFRRPRLLDFAGTSILQLPYIGQLVIWFGSGWKLAYKASVDGWAASKYHQLCDGKGRSITVIRTTHSVFGFYSPLTASSQSYYELDKTAFVFTLQHPKPLGFSKWKATAVRCIIGASKYGPYLNEETHIVNNANSSDVYPKSRSQHVKWNYDFERLPGDEAYFIPTEVEVYISSEI